jgi:patatin-like phospholipase/acyl hydrolase
MRRILAIDGGGVKGIFPAAFLAALEEETGRPAVEHFDLVAGTSTGGIIAIALGLGLSAAELVDFYRRHGPEIFRGHRLLRRLRQIAIAKYAHEPLRSLLTGAFGARLLGDSGARLLIPSLNLTTGRVHVFKTAHHPSLVRDWRMRAVDVALATVSAPTYFPIFYSAEGDAMVDGSLFARNPAGMAAVEAIGLLGWPRDGMRLLSIGCTARPMSAMVGKTRGGAGYWGARIAQVFMKAQSSGALMTADLLLGPENVLRVNPELPSDASGIDAVERLPELEALGRGEARRLMPELRALFLDSRAEPFTPCNATQSVAA